MSGYVDRYPPVSWLIAFAVPVVSAIAVVVALSAWDSGPDAVRIAIGILGGIGVLALLDPAYRLSLRPARLDFVPDVPPETDTWRQGVRALLGRQADRARAFAARKRVRQVTWVVGTLALAVVGNKISDAIPWP